MGIASVQLRNTPMVKGEKGLRAERLKRIRDDYSDGPAYRACYSGSAFIESNDPQIDDDWLSWAAVAEGVGIDEVRRLVNAPAAVGEVLDLFDDACTEIRRLQELCRCNGVDFRKPKPPPEPAPLATKNYAAEAAMRSKSGDEHFEAYLRAHHGLPLDADADAIQDCFRKAVGIKSKSELNSDPAAAARWQAFRNRLNDWSKRQ